MGARQHRGPLLAFGLVSALCAILLSTGGRSDATPGEYPTCARVALGGLTYRLLLDPGTVLPAPATSVRTDRLQWTQRRNGTWTSTQTIDPLVLPYVHVVVKSDGPGVRRASYWVRCSPAQP